MTLSVLISYNIREKNMLQINKKNETPKNIYSQFDGQATKLK